MIEIPLPWFRAFAAVCFAAGLYGVMSRRDAVGALMSTEVMLIAAGLHLVASWRLGATDPVDGRASGLAVALFAMAVVATQAAVGVGLVLALRGRGGGDDPPA